MSEKEKIATDINVGHKEIEEMAKVMYGYICKDRPCKECNYHGKSKILKPYCEYYLKAQDLYEKGYRKIPEGAVVLTREEYERLKRIENEKDRLYEIKLDLENQLIEKGWTDYEGADEIEKRARKEKAREIFEKAKEKCKELENKYSHLCKSKKECLMETCRYEGVLAVKRELYELAKQFGVEV